MILTSAEIQELRELIDDLVEERGSDYTLVGVLREVLADAEEQE